MELVTLSGRPVQAAPAGRLWRSRWCWTLGCVLLVSAAALAQTETPTQSTASTLPSVRETGTLQGLVTDTQGIPIIGAKLTFTSASESAGAREAASDKDGRFLLNGLAVGTWTVSATFPGFDTATAAADLHPSESLTLPPIAMKISTVKIDVDAVVPTRELAAEELHVEEKQRLLGFAPNFFVSYKWDAAPLTSGQKFKLAWKNASDPGNLLLVGTVAGFQQATDEFNGYGQGAAGYGKRYGADLGNLVAGTFLGGAVLPSLFHQDPRYFYKGTGSFKSRLVYALGSAVICRGDNGRRQFAWAGVLGDLSAGALSNAYYARADRHGAALTLENGVLGVAGDALNGLVQEFFFKQIMLKAKTKATKQ